MLAHSMHSLALLPAAPVAYSTSNLLYTANWGVNKAKCCLSSSSISFAFSLQEV